jgi:antirestriction protein ArdC
MLSLSGKYHGVNVPLLWLSASAAGYDTNLWASFDQWKDRGAHVRKGEHGTMIVFFKTIERTKAGADGEEDIERFPILRCWVVFNAAQVEGYTAPAIPMPALAERLEHAERFVSGTGAVIRHGSNRAFYAPGPDHIQMPPREAFIGSPTSTATESYYGTLLHELTHWCGHEMRCAREFGKRFGDHAYAAEELVAELGAAFLCAHLGIASEPRQDHAQYLASWLQILKGDKRAIFTAASKATQAMEYLRGIQAAQPAAMAA